MYLKIINRKKVNNPEKQIILPKNIYLNVDSLDEDGKFYQEINIGIYLIESSECLYLLILRGASLHLLKNVIKINWN